MNQVNLSLLIGALLSLARPSATLAAAEARPNVLIIHTDEHNFRTLGCYREHLPRKQAFIRGDGVTVETPHIDSVAHAGALCDRFYASSPVCTPSRASFVSGRYPQNTGADSNNKPLARALEDFAQRFKDPFAAEPAILADLDWCAEGSGSYAAPKRAPRRPGATESDE